MWKAFACLGSAAPMLDCAMYLCKSCLAVDNKITHKFVTNYIPARLQYSEVIQEPLPLNQRIALSGQWHFSKTTLLGADSLGNKER